MTVGPLEVRNVLARELAIECSHLGCEQFHYLGINQKTGIKSLVVVCTTDRATEAVLAFLDKQKEQGVTEKVRDDLEKIR